ncbi:sensor histidine kinase [Clostridium thermobutyricum]|nr:HAMP domain-containing sensor histidine kinase [Clostridium thermobutyricum]
MSREFIIFIIGVILIGFNIIFYIKIRKEICLFTDRMGFVLDKVLEEEYVDFNLNEETVLSKLESKIKLLQDSVNLKNDEIKKERDNVQKLIGDISHQIKTPLANMKLYTETVLYRDLEKDKRDEFLRRAIDNIEKLDWLMDSLVKSSRLENGIIEIKKEEVNLKEILEKALKDVDSFRKSKNININLECSENIKVYGDNKWLVEGIFNILDNGIKYSENNKSIEIKVIKNEIFTEIIIKDEGRGIESKNINNIFKRFYREEEVYNISGVGIGLYLSREIIEKVNGFIKVQSVKGKGSTFSIFLLNSLNITKL